MENLKARLRQLADNLSTGTVTTRGERSHLAALLREAADAIERLHSEVMDLRPYEVQPKQPPVSPERSNRWPPS